MLLPGEPLLNGVPSSKMCTTLEEIEEALDEAERVHVRVHCPERTWSHGCIVNRDLVAL
jgi:hypothetical protein